MLNSIENSKQNSLNQVLFALGIRHIGKKTSLDISNNFNSVNELLNSTYEELEKMNDMGEVKAKSLIDFFSNDTNKKLINELINLGIKMKPKIVKVNTNNLLNGKIVVVSGIIDGLTRNEVKEYLLSLGAKPTSSISNSTDYLIAGKKSSENKISKIESSKIIFVNNLKELNEKILK